MTFLWARKSDLEALIHIESSDAIVLLAGDFASIVRVDGISGLSQPYLWWRD